MKIINVGTTYRIYEDDVCTYDKLPSRTYEVCFSKMGGFFLESRDDIDISEKIYGVHEKKVEKIMNSFKVFTRNLGVILSGNKGIGKSICAKLLAKKSIEEGYPVILVNEYIPGIASYISSIKQECTVIFDEFDKTFNVQSNGDGIRPIKSEDGDCNSAQVEMLTLFDGLDQGKKLFIITCNKLTNLSDYLVNRPGRFHYHLRFDYPTADEIREYLRDKLTNYSEDEALKVIDFSGKFDLNYDCLRAIVFELNLGITFEDAIQDLNIVNINEYDNRYNVTVVLDNGTKLVEKDYHIDFYALDDKEDRYIRFYFSDGDVLVSFNPSKNKYNVDLSATTIDEDGITGYKPHIRRDNDECDGSLCGQYDDCEECPQNKAPDKNALNENTKSILRAKPKYLIFKRKTNSKIHYMV